MSDSLCQGAREAMHPLDESRLNDLALAVKRPAHNALERQRREDLNTKLQQLAHALPSLHAVRRPSKATIVAKALEFVTMSISREITLQKTIDSLRQENESLRSEAKRQSPTTTTSAAVEYSPAPLTPSPFVDSAYIHPEQQFVVKSQERPQRLREILPSSTSEGTSPSPLFPRAFSAPVGEVPVAHTLAAVAPSATKDSHMSRSIESCPIFNTTMSTTNATVFTSSTVTCKSSRVRCRKDARESVSKKRRTRLTTGPQVSMDSNTCDTADLTSHFTQTMDTSGQPFYHQQDIFMPFADHRQRSHCYCHPPLFRTSMMVPLSPVFGQTSGVGPQQTDVAVHYPGWAAASDDGGMMSTFPSDMDTHFRE
ncbi:hypothetical protein BX666DRAFT_161680 [Dichotomocladium elegans]|nr:hypothetical protein BX666DRAFT_161680 [Dichotomocladium elegans]